MAKPPAKDETSARALRLTAFVAEQEGVPTETVRVSGLRRLAGGASRLLWSVDVEVGERALALVLRQDPPGRVLPGGMELEFALLQAARKEGVPVPDVHWCTSDAAVLGAPFFAMERIDGEAIARRLLRDERYAKTRRVLCGELGESLARVQRIDPDPQALASRLARPPEGQTPAEAEVDRVVTGYREFAVEPHPVLDLAERWLRERAPTPARVGFVHGDYRVGNVMFDEAGTRAILDWELAHVGDPVEDLGWLCVRAWRFGNDALAVGGVGTRDELVAAYEGAGGDPVDREALRWWEVAGNFKLALVFITQARAYLDGAHPTVELASLGRRTAEAEDELLRLMEGDP
ncbi:MAG: phosphotransferase family protein [Proteobacteria bacterium]|nr:phosphotransferase family protein [Pseudomonadota bacterium]